VLGVRVAGNLNIDTDLADISPTTRSNPETQIAIDQLAASIEQRITLLISGQDEGVVFAAEGVLRERLGSVSGVSLLPSSELLLTQLVEGLRPYRFSLLSESQRQLLEQSTPLEIAQQAQASLYELSGPPRLYSFADDPLAWHSATLMSILNTPGAGLSVAENEIPTQENTGSLYSTAIGLRLNKGALNMQNQRALTAVLDSEIEQLRADFKVRLDRSGVFFFAAQAAKNAKQDISRISFGSILGVIILLLLAFRTVRALLLPVFSVVLGVGFAFIATHTIHGSVHVLTIVFGASLIGIVIDYSLHYFYHGAQDDQDDKEKSGLPSDLALSLVTSLIGYAALSFSDLAALQKVALFSCCGLLMAWLSVVVLGELFLRKSMQTDQRIFPLISNSSHS
jgi:predicted exporter